MRLRSALLAATLIVACLSAALVGSSAPRASAEGPHRAVVVADSGTGVLVRGIEFGGDSISGLEALQLAGLAPVVQGFQGEGGAVCALAGVGCPSDGSCLTCDARGYYWAYHRALAGSGGFAYSRTGAGSTRVHDGDVEGWKWGTGAAPPFHSFESVFPPTPPSTTPPVPSPGPGGSNDGGAGGGSQALVGTTSPSANPAAASGAGGEAAAGPAATTTTVAGATTSSSSPTTAEAAAGDRTTTAASGAADEIAFQAAQSGRPDQPASRRGQVASVVLFAVTLAAVAALIVRNRRRRRARGVPGPAS